MSLDAAQAAIYLADAWAKYHALVTGTSARVVVDQNGERVEYTAASAARLKQWIDELEAIVGVKKVTGPLKVFF